MTIVQLIAILLIIIAGSSLSYLLYRRWQPAPTRRLWAEADRGGVEEQRQREFLSPALSKN